jgi:hypothetical protein
MGLSKKRGMWRRAAGLLRSLGAAIAIASVAAPASRGEALARELDVPTSWASNPTVREALAPADDLGAASAVEAEGQSVRGGLLLRLTDFEHRGHSLYW